LVTGFLPPGLGGALRVGLYLAAKPRRGGVVKTEAFQPPFLDVLAGFLDLRFAPCASLSNSAFRARMNLASTSGLHSTVALSAHLGRAGVDSAWTAFMLDLAVFLARDHSLYHGMKLGGGGEGSGIGCAGSGATCRTNQQEQRAPQCYYVVHAAPGVRHAPFRGVLRNVLTAVPRVCLHHPTAFPCLHSF